MRAGAPQQKKKSVNRGLGVIVVVIAAIIIIAVAYFATRPGGFGGRSTLTELQMEKAKAAGYDSPEEMMKSRFGGGNRGGQ